MQLTRSGWATMTGLVLALTVALPYWLDVLPTTDDPASLLAYALLVLSGCSASRLIASGEARFVAFTFWLYVYIWGALAPLVQLRTGVLFWPGTYTSDVRTRAMLVTAIGVAGWWFAYRLVAKTNTRPAGPASVPRAALIAIGGMGVAAVGVAVVGPELFTSSRQAVSEHLASLTGDSTESGLIRAAVSVPAVVGFLLLAQLWREGRLRRRHKLLTALAAASTVLVANPVANARYWFAAVAFAAAITVWGAPGRRAAVLMGAMLVGALVLFPAADAFRYSGGESKPLGLNRSSLTSGDYDAYQQTMNGLRYAEDEGHSFGRQIVGPLVFFVPRSSWSGKPVSTGPLVAEAAGYDYTNLSSPAWVEGYIDFGWPGAALVGLLFGAFGSHLERDRSTVGTVVGALFAGYQVVLLRGSLLSVFPYLALAIALAAMTIARYGPCLPRSMLEERTTEPQTAIKVASSGP